jgi:hypothetical protein
MRRPDFAEHFGQSQKPAFLRLHDALAAGAAAIRYSGSKTYLRIKGSISRFPIAF